MDKDGPMETVSIQINNGEQWKTTDSNGIVEFNRQLLHNIEYHFLFQNEKIQIEDQNNNEIEILIKDMESGSVDFLTDYKILLKHKKLIFDSKYSLKKTSINKKQWE